MASLSGQVLTSNTSGTLTWESRGFNMYDAIVSLTTGEGDYTSISAAITGGALSIFVRDGTYSENFGCYITSQYTFNR